MQAEVFSDLGLRGFGLAAGKDSFRLPCGY